MEVSTRLKIYWINYPWLYSLLHDFCKHLIVCVKNINHNIHKDENHCFILSFESLEFRLHFAELLSYSFILLFLLSFEDNAFQKLWSFGKEINDFLFKKKKFRCVIRPLIIYIPIKDEHPAILDRTHSLIQICILVKHFSLNELLILKYTWNIQSRVVFPNA